jgi:hypothetical protein
MARNVLPLCRSIMRPKVSPSSAVQPADGLSTRKIPQSPILSKRNWKMIFDRLDADECSTSRCTPLKR